jgi:hypothetical protein
MKHDFPGVLKRHGENMSKVGDIAIKRIRAVFGQGFTLFSMLRTI